MVPVINGPLSPTPGDRPHPAALAPNWRSVLALDAALGIAAIAVGVVLAIWSNLGAGAVLVVLGSVYATLVALRARRWARMRRDAGLSD